MQKSAKDPGISILKLPCRDIYPNFADGTLCTHMLVCNTILSKNILMSCVAISTQPPCFCETTATATA